ncbi:MAG: retron system putative HNH endonuclease [Litorimonas sp.]
MRDISKGQEPRSLTQHRLQLHSTYENYPNKRHLRDALVKEQYGLCCYCAGRIRANADSMKIEHWRCQTAHQNLQLTYSNLLGACRGGDGQSSDKHHCDTKKANLDLKWNPANDGHPIDTRIKYDLDGRITCTDQEFCDQLNSVLGLNLPFLRNNRKAVLDAVLFWWRSTPAKKRNLQSQINRRTIENDVHEPFSPVAVWFLREKLTRAAQ